MDVFSILIGCIFGMVLTGFIILFVMWRIDADDDKKEKKWSDADFDRIFHDAWIAGFEYGKRFPFAIDEEDQNDHT